jgi:predicted acyl esterase
MMLRIILLLTLLTIPVFAGQRYALPTERYAVRVEVNVRVPMRDGVKLATDLYFPQGLEGRLPAIIRKVRTEAARLFAGQGYVIAVQDVRGKFDSEGQFTVAANDTNDGSDTLDWMAAQPCVGKPSAAVSR